MASDGHGQLAARRRRAGHFLRLHGQECAGAAACLASRCHGRPYSRLRPRALCHDGGGWRLPHRTVLSLVHPRRAHGDCLRRSDHPLARGDDRAGLHRHQTGACLFDGQPTRLHDARPRGWRLGCRPLPSRDARLLQEPAVSLLGLGDPRLSHQRHAADGRVAQEDAWRSLGQEFRL
jgi:hypothetical protein